MILQKGNLEWDVFFFLTLATVRSSRVNLPCVGRYQTSLSVRIPTGNPLLSPLSEISPVSNTPPLPLFRGKKLLLAPPLF